MVFFFFKRTTAYDMRISDWSSDECSSDLNLRGRDRYAIGDVERGCRALEKGGAALARFTQRDRPIAEQGDEHPRKSGPCPYIEPRSVAIGPVEQRSEEHTSELQSLMRISYAVFCLKKKKTTSRHQYNN